MAIAHMDAAEHFQDVGHGDVDQTEVFGRDRIFAEAIDQTDDVGLDAFDQRNPGIAGDDGGETHAVVSVFVDG